MLKKAMRSIGIPIVKTIVDTAKPETMIIFIKPTKKETIAHAIRTSWRSIDLTSKLPKSPLAFHNLVEYKMKAMKNMRKSEPNCTIIIIFKALTP